MIDANVFVDAARDVGLHGYTGVPCSYLTPLINHAIGNASSGPSAVGYVAAANEGDAVAIAAGAAIGGRRTVVMMQNSGLGNAVSPLTSLTHPFRIPLLLVVTLRGDPEIPDEPQHGLMGPITTDLLSAMEIPWAWFPDRDADVVPVLTRAAAHMDATGRPYALVLRKGAVAPCALPEGLPAPGRASGLGPDPITQTRSGPLASRGDILERIVARTAPGDASSGAPWVIIGTTGYTGRELSAVADRDNHLYMVGSMGCVASLGLGLALARPDLRVLVVDGDGAAMMRMGNLATVGAYGASNLTHLVLDNGRYDSTGGQQTVSGGISFAGIARSCGYGATWQGDNPAMVDALLNAPTGTPTNVGRPQLAHLRIRPGVPANLPRPVLTPEAVVRRLVAHIGSPPLSNGDATP